MGHLHPYCLFFRMHFYAFLGLWIWDMQSTLGLSRDLLLERALAEGSSARLYYGSCPKHLTSPSSLQNLLPFALTSTSAPEIWLSYASFFLNKPLFLPKLSVKVNKLRAIRFQ